VVRSRGRLGAVAVNVQAEAPTKTFRPPPTP